ncbi:MAG TPA: FG-GAP-like repeat-containing protein [Candidatus Polarisedimenticolia bacterium]|nr:FG-GAP-like repeat-containing protein [Candidatus Polarisedimenticolia bacterium]
MTLRRLRFLLPAVLTAAGATGALLLWGGPAAPLAQTSSPSDSEALRQGLDLARQGRLDEAAARLRQHVVSHPDDARGRFYLGRVLSQIAQSRDTSYADAVAELEAALRIDPTQAVVKMQLADVYGVRRPGVFKPDRTVAIYEELLQAHPDRQDVRMRFVKWIFTGEARLARSGDPQRVLQDSAWAMDLARFHLEKILDQTPPLSPAGLEARTFLGEVQYRMGEWDAARATFEGILADQKGGAVNLAPAWNTIGHARWRKGEHAAALEAFQKAYDLAPSLQHLYDIKLAHDSLSSAAPALPERYRFPLRPEAVDPSAPPALRFTDIAPKLHIDKLAGAGPCGWADYDGDGRYDLMACGCDAFCTLYRADKEGFTDTTLAAGLARTEPGFGLAWADYDNDGDPDASIARNGWNGPAPNSLLRNNGDGTFSDVAAAAGVDDRGSSFHTAWLDYDRDGWLDLIVSNGVYLDGSANRLYRNRGDGTFEDATHKAGLAESPGFGTIGVALGDYDADGWQDIFFHGRTAPNRLYRNNKDGTFTDVAERAGVKGPGTQNGFIALFSDLDSDGDLDLFTGSLAPWEQVLHGYRPGYEPGPLDHIPRLYRNNGDGTFRDDSVAAGLKYPIGIMAAGIADLDNDGYQDIYLGTGDPELRRVEPNIFYHNRSGRVFEDLTRFTGLGALGKGHGITFIDWDRDGDLEIYAELGGFFHGDWWRNAFYLNEQGSRNHWLQVELSQPRLNRRAVGATVTVAAGSWRQVQQVTAGRGFGSTDPPVLHFGLGAARQADSVTVVWPDGTRQMLKDQRAGRLIAVRKS